MCRVWVLRFVHPVIRRLPPAQMIAVEQGLLRTFDRAYPILMPLSGLLLIVYAGWGGGAGGPSLWRWLAVVAWSIATITTLVVNVPINVATGKWDPHSPPEDWRELRHRWELFQAIRAWTGPGRAPDRRHSGRYRARPDSAVAPGSPWTATDRSAGAISRTPSPCALSVAIRCRSSRDRYRFDRTSSASRSGGTPPFSARHRYSVFRPMPT